MPSHPPAPVPPSPEADLAAQGRMLRGLAGKLVGDPAAADDVVQEAWLAALQRRPDADRPLEPWLKRVVRNLSARFKRDRARRDRRERRAARPEHAPDAHALAERARLLRALLDEVLTLPEAEREAVLLRYYEGLPPRAIAQRLGAPVELVYRRLEHAVERLRGRMDARHGGARQVWCVGLVAALGLPRELLGPGTLAAAGLSATGATVGVGAAATSASVPFAGALLMGSTASTVTVTVLTLGVGLGAGWFAHGRFGADVGGAGARGAAEEAEGASLTAEHRPEAPRLEGSEGSKREAALQAEVRSLRAQVATLAAEKEALEKAHAEATAPLDPKALRFGLAGSTPNFDKADWAMLSGHMSEMNKIMPRVLDALAKGEGLGSELQQSLGEHNTPLAIFAVSTSSELKGSGPNGAFTHPAVIANLMRSALLAAGDPLTQAQEAALVTLGNAWAADHERSTKALPADAPALAVTIAEVDAKDRFLQSAKAQLSASQRTVLFHPDTEDRLGLDLLSPALVYMLHADGGVPSAEALPARAIALLLGGAGVKAEEQAAFHGVGTQWAAETPAGTTPQDLRSRDVTSPRLGVLQAFARAQLGATQRILDSGRLTPEQAAKLRKQTVLVLPYVVQAR